MILFTIKLFQRQFEFFSQIPLLETTKIQSEMEGKVQDLEEKLKLQNVQLIVRGIGDLK